MRYKGAMSASDSQTASERSERLDPTDRKARFERDGFLVLPGFVDPSECAVLMTRANELVRSVDLDALRSVFSTTEQLRTADDYFLGSGDTIRYFLEAEALSPAGARSPTGTRPEAAADPGEPRHGLNKIGHALHDLDPVFSRFSRQPALAQLVSELGVVEPRLIQSMYIFKQPHIGGEVVYHQDATFLYTEPPSVIGLWFALQDATEDNGCLYTVPGSHRRGLGRRFRRSASGGVEFEELDPRPLDVSRAEEIPLCAQQGTLVVLHGLLPHRSGPNRSARSRHAYTLHVISGRASYPRDNWLQRPSSFPAAGF